MTDLALHSFITMSTQWRRGLENSDPVIASLNQMLLQADRAGQSRGEFKGRLELWYTFLRESEDLEQILSKAIDRSETVSNLLNNNLQRVLDAEQRLKLCMEIMFILSVTSSYHNE